jgi:hypothetical protein
MVDEDDCRIGENVYRDVNSLSKPVSPTEIKIIYFRVSRNTK